MSLRRAGVSAVEFIVFTALSLMLIYTGYTLLQNATVVGSTTQQGLELQQGMRNLMENLVKDVNAAAFIAEPHGLTSLGPPGPKKVVLWVFNDKMEANGDGLVQPGERLTLNDGPDGAGLVGGRNPWPFYHTGGPTRWHVPVMQIIYEWKDTEKAVYRTAQPGEVWMEALQAGKPFVDKVTFHPTGAGAAAAPKSRKMAINVTEFQAFPFGFNELKLDTGSQYGELRPTSELPDLVTGVGASPAPVVAGFGGATGGGGTAGTTDRIVRTAMLLVKVKAHFDYVSERYRDQEIYQATKIFSYAKLYEHIYAPYFSSIDDDLRF